MPAGSVWRSRWWSEARQLLPKCPQASRGPSAGSQLLACQSSLNRGRRWAGEGRKNGKMCVWGWRRTGDGRDRSGPLSAIWPFLTRPFVLCVTCFSWVSSFFSPLLFILPREHLLLAFPFYFNPLLSYSLVSLACKWFIPSLPSFTLVPLRLSPCYYSLVLLPSTRCPSPRRFTTLLRREQWLSLPHTHTHSPSAGHHHEILVPRPRPPRPAEWG